jgi:hypothetical protein
VLVCGLLAGEARAQAGFRTEGRPAIDDVFGDASDFRKTIDRFIELTAQMQVFRDEFARSVQTIFAELTRADLKGKRVCNAEVLANPYARAHRLGSDYLRVGRELGRLFDVVREYDRLGETIGLTPDYRWRVRRVLSQYQSLLVDYREMKVAFHDQLHDELKYIGCNLEALMQKGDPQWKLAVEESWPQPGTQGAPFSPNATQQVKTDATDKPPANLPPERIITTPVSLPKKAAEPVQKTGIVFYVDNTKCGRGTAVFLDGKRVGDVTGLGKGGFQTAPGPHDLCLLDDEKKTCGAPGTIRKSYLHDGWTVSLRCD